MTVKLCLVGQPFWIRKIAEIVNREGQGRIQASIMDMFSPKWPLQVGRFLEADVILRVGFRPGSPGRGQVFDALWRFLLVFNRKAEIVFYWVGTDVLKMTEDMAVPEKRRRLAPMVEPYRHIAGAPWLAEELQAVGVPAEHILFPAPLPKLEEPPPLPEQFTVLSYVLEDKHAFYGGLLIEEMARRFPGVRFDVLAGKGEWVTQPLENLHFHGWQPDPASFYARSTVVMRLVPHDAIGGTVREALAYARHVVYTYRLPHTNFVPYGDTEALARVLGELWQAHQAGGLGLNAEGRAYALEAFDETKTGGALIAYLERVMGAR